MPSAWEEDRACWELKGVSVWESPDRAMSRLKLWSSSARKSGGGSASSGRKEGSSSSMSCSGLDRFCEQSDHVMRMMHAYLALPASGSSAVCFTVRSITSRAFRALSASERM